MIVSESITNTVTEGDTVAQLKKYKCYSECAQVRLWQDILLQYAASQALEMNFLKYLNIKFCKTKMCGLSLWQLRFFVLFLSGSVLTYSSDQLLL